jgi:hypothetical protein
LRRPVESAQYTSLAFGRRLQQAGLVASMGTVGDALDNAVAESFFATLECELLDRHAWPTRQGLRTAVFDFIEVFYNRQRRHSTLGYASPLPAMSSTHQPHPPHNHRVHESGATPVPCRTAFGRRRAGRSGAGPSIVACCTSGERVPLGAVRLVRRSDSRLTSPGISHALWTARGTRPQRCPAGQGWDKARRCTGLGRAHDVGVASQRSYLDHHPRPGAASCPGHLVAGPPARAWHAPAREPSAARPR